MIISRRLLAPAITVVSIVGAAVPARAQVDSTPPVASIAITAALGGPETVSFDESVRSVSTENVVLRVSGTTADVSATRACAAGDGSPANCSSGDVRRVTLRPSSPLVAGQGYTVIVNPEGATPVADTSGNPAALTQRSFRASTTEQELSLGATYGWRAVRDDAALDDTYRTEHVAGAYMTFRFTGTSVRWYTRVGPAEGRASVSVDGENQGVVDNYARTARLGVARTYAGLVSGSHRITIRVRGQRNSASTGTWVAIDGFRAGGTTYGSPAGTWRWRIVRDSHASEGSYATTDAKGARASFVFRAPGIDWYTNTGPDQGKAGVYIDGTLKKTIDNYSQTRRYGVRWTISGLNDAVHTVMIVVAGSKSSSSRGTFVAIDRWSLRAPTAVFKRLGVWVDVWDYGVSGGLDPSVEIPKMRDHGVKTIYIETARASDSSAFKRQSAIPAWIEGAHAAGIKVLGWYLPYYCDSLDTDVSRTVAIARYRTPAGQSFDGLGVDIEYRRGCDYDNTKFNAGITEHLRRVRSGAGVTYPIGAITPAPLGMAVSPSSWSGFPWSSIGRYATAVLPMGYWSYRTDCDTKPAHCAYGYTKGNVAQARANTGLPVHVIGGVADDVTTAEVADFARAADDANAYGGSIYDYKTTASSFWTSLEKLNSL